MKKLGCILIAMVFLFPWSLAAESLKVGGNLTLNFDSPQGWELSEEAPGFLVEELAGHVLHELEEQGREVDPRLVRQKVSERLSANEGYLYNPRTGAHLIIDFSPLGADEKKPSRRSVSASARYAGEQLQQEEGIESVRFSTKKISLPGAESAYRVEADYLQHGQSRKFIGVIGFASPSWFFLYYTDPLQDPEDAISASRIFDSMKVVSGS